jgi:hypothetical protein
MRRSFADILPDSGTIVIILHALASLILLKSFPIRASLELLFFICLLHGDVHAYPGSPILERCFSPGSPVMSSSMTK